jgi:[ribosomal protein S5]-alanine N-acetyltransferase
MSPPDRPLTDGVVTLRVPDERDLPAIERAIRDRSVVRAFGGTAQSARAVLELNRSRWRDGTGPTFAICVEKEECVGHVFVNLGGVRRGSVGYWLLPDARGQGLATRAVRLISRWAFEDLGLARLQLLAEPWNVASQRVAERSGFQREGCSDRTPRSMGGESTT